jgi:phosphatidylinositol alpha 1,6-mannosyltransferase
MKIAYVSGIPGNGHDGVARVVRTLIGAAVGRNHDVCMVTASLDSGCTFDYQVHYIPSVPFPLQKAYRLAIPGTGRVNRALEAFDPDLIHIHSPCTLGFEAMRFGNSRGTPVIATYHTHFPTYLSYYRLRLLDRVCWKLLRSIYNRADCTIVPSMPVLRELENNGLHRLVCIPNGVDTDVFSPSHRSAEWRREVSGDVEKPIVLFVSRLVWEKNLKILADAYSIIRSSAFDHTMVVVGDGPARAQLERMMPGAVFLGYRSGVELSAAYASSDIFVFPSVSESFGLVTLEAMASAVVPVAARQGGAADVILDGQSGFLVPPNDTTAMAERVLLLLADPALRRSMSHSALEASAAYSWHNVLNRIFEMYERLAGSSAAKNRILTSRSKHTVRRRYGVHTA